MNKQFGVDKARFLAFAAALAGAATFQACSATDKKPVDNAGGETSEGGKGAAAGAKSEAGETSEGGSAGEQPAGGAAGSSSEGGASGASDGGASEGGAGGAAECSDNVGVADCTGLTAVCKPYCNAAISNLKPAAADDAIACLKLDTTGNCDTGYGCLANGTAKGCFEDVVAACATAKTECMPAGAGEPSCEQLLSGLKTAARTEVVSCISEGCYSVYSCAEGLFFE